MKYEVIPQYQREALKLTGHYGKYSSEIRHSIIEVVTRFNSKTCPCKKAKLLFEDIEEALQFADLLSACKVVKVKISRRKNLVQIVNLYEEWEA